MPRQFVTQLVSQRPTVLCIGIQGSVSADFTQTLKSEYEVVACDFHEVESCLKSISADLFRVAIFWTGVESVQVLEYLAPLRSSPVPIKIIYCAQSQITNTQSDPRLEELALNDTTREVSLIIASLPKAQWLFIQDLLHPQILQDHWVWQLLLNSLRRSQLPQAVGGTFRPTTFEVVAPKIQSFIASPRSLSSSLSGEEQQLAVLFAELFKQTTQSGKVLDTSGDTLVVDTVAYSPPFHSELVEVSFDLKNILIETVVEPVLQHSLSKSMPILQHDKNSDTSASTLPSPTVFKKSLKAITDENFRDHSKTQNQLEHSVAPIPQQPQEAPPVLSPAQPEWVVNDAQRTEIVPQKSPVRVSVPEIANQTTQTQETVNYVQQKAMNSQVSPEAALSGEIEKIFSVNRASQQVSRIQEQTQIRTKVVKRTKKKRALFYSGIVSAAVGLGVLFMAGVFVMSQKMLEQSIQTIVTSTVQQQEIPESSWDSVTFQKELVSSQTQVYSLFFDLLIFDSTTRYLELVDQLKIAKEAEQESSEVSKKMFLSIMGRESQDLSVLTEKMAFSSQKGYEALSLVQANLEELAAFNETWDEQTATSFAQLVQSSRKSAAINQQLQPQLASMFGVQGKKTYAIVLQNNQELRPTGGFIKAVALVTFENGALISQKVVSSYEVDALVAGAVIPPEDLVKYLGEKQLYFRDSNWDPDYSLSAARMVWFLENAYSTRVDAVVSVNLSSLRDTIEAIGPLELKEFSEVITHKNLFERSEFHSEEVLVETETTKDFSKVLLSALLQKIQSLEEEKISEFYSVLHEELASQEILVWYAQPELQASVKSLGWTGELLKPSCPSQFVQEQCFVDSVAQVEANVGVNKANYYLDRNTQHTVTITPSAASHSRTTTFKNTAQSASWPRGSYKAYVRVIVPESVATASMAINSVQVPASDITVQRSKGFVSFGTYVEVPVQKTVTLTTSYSTPLPSFNSQLSYVLFEQKQSGVGPHPEKVAYVLPPGLIPTLIAPQATVSGSQIHFTSEADSNQLFAVALSKL